MAIRECFIMKNIQKVWGVSGTCINPEHLVTACQSLSHLLSSECVYTDNLFGYAASLRTGKRMATRSQPGCESA